MKKLTLISKKSPSRENDPFYRGIEKKVKKVPFLGVPPVFSLFRLFRDFFIFL